MFIKRNMKEYILEKNTKRINPDSGATINFWERKGPIFCSLYPVSQNTINTSALVNEYNFIGLTERKNIKKGIYRIIDSDGTVFEFTECKVIGKFTQLFLKEINDNV